MTDITNAPDISLLEIPMDPWTQAFWDHAAQGELVLPRCAACQRFRWPPGPFCPHCRSQQTEWMPAGLARIYSFTIVHDQRHGDTGIARVRVPALIEFPEADGIRLLAAIVDTPLTDIQVGVQLQLAWSQAANARVPVFSVVR